MADQGSTIDRLKAARKRAIERDRSLVLPVPGWEGPYVFVRYKPVEWERLYALLTQVEDDDAKASLDANLEALTSACDAILVKDEGDAKPKSLADVLREQGEQVYGEVRFDQVAIDVLGLTVKNAVGEDRPPADAAETCLAVFAGAVSPELAVGEHSARLGAHMRGVSQGVDEALLGG